MLKKAFYVYKMIGLRALKNEVINFISRRIRKPAVAAQNTQLFNQLFNQACNDRTDYVPFQINKPIKTDIKLIAFYLPQFHPIPENDAWWGKGFTEWTNVSKAVPQFVGHYQPHLPGELGFYDLRLLEIQKRQIELAKNYGIHGFCYYHYWFSGKKLLSRPFQTVLENPELDLPFCLCWANENWTRKWDGLENEMLIKQIHSAEDDLAFIADIADTLRDQRYIRIDGRPLLIIYKITLLPDPAATAKRWREYCINAGVGDLYLVAVQIFGITAIPAGFDALMEFPPHHLAVGAPSLKSQLNMINPNYQGEVVDYHYIVERASAIKASSFKLFRTIFPSWDNEARKPGCGYTFANATPALFSQWLHNMVTYTQKNNEEKLVFINAWNEWAEGAHLEPDRKYGYAWLQACYDVLYQKIISVSHDAHSYAHNNVDMSLHN
jgi:lipopolysaccharide biosynthesis protein